MLKVEKSALVAALASLKRAVNSRNTIPILGNALFEKDGDDLVVTGSNLDIQISARCAATFDEGFQTFTAPYTLLESAAKSMADGPIQIDNPTPAGRLDNIVIKAGRARIRMPILPAGDFPKIKTDALKCAIGLGAASLKRTFLAVEFAMSEEETRYYLKGVYMHPDEGGLMFVATDGAKLALRLMPMTEIDEDTLPEMPSVIIPRDTVTTIARILPDDGNVAVRLSDERIEFSFANLTVVSKFVDGTFPDYRRVVPANNGNIIQVNGKQLSAAINRVLTVNTMQGSGVRFTFTTDTLRLTSKPGENGEAEDEVPVGASAEIEIGFNGEYMRAVIDALGGGDIVLKLGSPGDPAMIMKPGETKSFAILMPMRM